jgi:hypothetical protein
MNRLQILSAAKAVLATGSGQPEKHLAICFAIDAVSKRSPKIAEAIKTEIMAHLKPHLSFRSMLGSSYNTGQIQAARHVYIDTLIKEAAK